MIKIGDCINEDLINELFGSVTDFACLVEEHGNEFEFDNVHVTYDSETDIHSFFKEERKNATHSEIYFG